MAHWYSLQQFFLIKNIVFVRIRVAATTAFAPTESFHSKNVLMLFFRSTLFPFLYTLAKGSFSMFVPDTTGLASGPGIPCATRSRVL